MPNLKKIPVADLKVGMYLYALSGSWVDHPFWRSKFIINDPNDILLIEKSAVVDAWIDVEKSAGELQIGTQCALQIRSDADSGNDPHAVRLVENNSIQPTPMAMEVEQARKILAGASRIVNAIFDNARNGKPFSLEGAREAVQQIAFSLTRNPAALICVARTKTPDDYAAMHAVAVSALMMVLARQLGQGDSEVREAGLAGLLHDIGEVDTPGEILNRPGALTDTEFAVIKHHAVQAHCLLVENGQMNSAVQDVCLHHHERLDGSGYPFGLAGAQISRLARMAAICDVYDAITSNRPHRKSLGPAQAVRMIAECCTDKYDPEVFDAFVACVGMYPIGSTVRLRSGKLAVVVEHNPDMPMAPRVKVLFAPEKGFCNPPELIDLSLVGAYGADSAEGTSAAAEEIVDCEDAAKWNLQNLNQMWAC